MSFYSLTPKHGKNVLGAKEKEKKKKHSKINSQRVAYPKVENQKLTVCMCHM